MNGVKWKDVTGLSETHALEVPVDHSMIVHIDQTLRDVTQLRDPHNRQ